MAGTYYKYAERGADSQINWGQVGKDLTDMLQEQNKIREEKKAAIDKASREFGETLANAPQGENKQINQWALEYAADAQEARLLQDRLLKSGRLGVKDYTVMRQNINDGTAQAFNLVKEYQAEYSEKMKRYKEGKSQELERWLMAQAEGFANFEQSKLYINPTDFRVSVGKMVKKVVDGKEVMVMDQDPNSFTTVNALRNRIKSTFDKYDVPTSIGAMVDSLGVEINSIQRIGTLNQTGSITETLDITKRQNLPKDAQGVIMKFEEAETKMLQAQLENPYNTSSILTNTVGFAPNGKEYTFTFNEAERNADPSKILLRNSESGTPMPEFTEEQKKIALERLRLEARMQYDKKVEIKATPQAQLQERRPLTDTEYNRKDLKAEAENFAKNLAAVLTGDVTSARQGSDYFKAIPGITALDITPTGINIFEGSTALPYVFNAGGGDATPEKMARALVKALNRGDNKLPEDMIIDAFKRFTQGKSLSKPNVGKVGRIGTDFSKEMGTFASAKVKTGVVEDDPQATVKNLTDTFGKLGYSFEGDTRGLMNDDFIKITGPNGKSSDWIKIDDLSKLGEIANFIRDNRDDATLEQSGLPEFKSKIPQGGGGAPRG